MQCPLCKLELTEYQASAFDGPVWTERDSQRMQVVWLTPTREFHRCNDEDIARYG